MQFELYAAGVTGRARAAATAYVLAIGACIFAAPPADAKWERACGSVREHYTDQGGGEYILASKIVGHEIGCKIARKVADA
jgi:hypothetical protein